VLTGVSAFRCSDVCLHCFDTIKLASTRRFASKRLALEISKDFSMKNTFFETWHNCGDASYAENAEHDSCTVPAVNYL